MTQSSTQPRNCRSLVSSSVGSSVARNRPSPSGSIGPRDVGTDLEPAGLQLGLDHLPEGLALLAALGVGLDDEIRPAARDRLVGGERRLPQREHGDDADRETGDAEEELER